MRAQRLLQIVLCLLLGGLVAALAGCFGPWENRAPVAAFTATPESGYAPLAVRLDARASRDPDKDPLTFSWTFDDEATAAGSVLDRTFSAGTHTILLRVTDGRGGEGVATRTVSAQAVPEGYLPRQFAWTTRGAARSCTFLIPLDLYQMYKGRIRTGLGETHAYADYVLDPLDDPTLEDYAQVLWAHTQNVEAFVDDALAFVQQAIRYRRDPSKQEWPWYPLETLVAGEGDCEDSAILFASLLRARGIAVSLAFVDTDADRLPDHVLALVPVTAAWASRLACPREGLILGSVLYAVAETAGDGGEIWLGCDPWDLTPDDVYEIWPL